MPGTVLVWRCVGRAFDLVAQQHRLIRRNRNHAAELPGGEELARIVKQAQPSERVVPISARELLRGQRFSAELVEAVAQAAIRTGKPPAVTGEEGVASLEIATRCLEVRPTAVSVASKGPRRVAG